MLFDGGESVVMMMAKQRQPQYKHFMLILYPDDPTYEDRMRHLMENYSTWAYILHDKDVNADGELKKPHVHFLIKMPNARILNDRLAEDLKTPLNMIEIVYDWAKAVRYLVHAE